MLPFTAEKKIILGQIWKSLLPFLSCQFDAFSPIFILLNITIFIESKNTGGICRQNMHLSIESA